MTVPRAIESSLQGVLLSWAIEPSLQGSVCLGPSSQVSKGSSCLGWDIETSLQGVLVSWAIEPSLQGVLVSWANEPSLQWFLVARAIEPSHQGVLLSWASSHVSMNPRVLGHRAKQPKAPRTATKHNQDLGRNDTTAAMPQACDLDLGPCGPTCQGSNGFSCIVPLGDRVRTMIVGIRVEFGCASHVSANR